MAVAFGITLILVNNLSEVKVADNQLVVPLTSEFKTEQQNGYSFYIERTAHCIHYAAVSKCSAIFGLNGSVTATLNVQSKRLPATFQLDDSQIQFYVLDKIINQTGKVCAHEINETVLECDKYIDSSEYFAVFNKTDFTTFKVNKIYLVELTLPKFQTGQFNFTISSKIASVVKDFSIDPEVG